MEIKKTASAAAIICLEVDHSQYFVVITPTTMGYFIVLCADDGVASDLFSSEKRGMTKNINSICGAADGKQNVKNNTPLLLLARKENSFHLILIRFLHNIYSHSRLLLVCCIYIYKRSAALFGVLTQINKIIVQLLAFFLRMV